jgi:ribosome-binding factor A
MIEQKDRRASLFRELAAEFIATEASASPLITVTDVRLSSDFGHATIFVTVYPEDHEEQALNFLKRKGSEFRGFVKKKGHIKVIPFFDFKVDFGDKNRRHLDSLTTD